MTNLDAMLARGEDHAKHANTSGALMPSLPKQLPHVQAVIIGCADMRVDPAQIFGLKEGQAVVMRNIGGRVTPRVLEQLGLLGRIGQVAEAIPGGGEEFHLIVLQHTDCGITRLNGDPALLASYFEIGEDQIEAKSVMEPRAAVAADVAALRAVPGLPAAWLLSGLVYDVATGKIEVVVPAAAIGEAGG